MIRVDITEQWPELSTNPEAMRRFVLGLYGADRAELADWPHARLLDKDGRPIGLMLTYGYPRVTIENDRLYLELAELEKEQHHEPANGSL